jgi:hypothetical protein
MDLEKFEKRQAITSWRDRLQFAAWALVNESGKKARASLEQQIHEAGIQNSLWDPSHFARERIDAAMRTSLEAALGGLLKQAARELQALDTAYGALSDSLIAGVAQFIYPNTPTPEVKQDKYAPVTAALAPAKQRFSAITNFVAQKVVSKVAREWGTKALDQLSEAADAASQKIQNNTGLHDRLRRAAVERIARAWMCDHGDHRPLMAQLAAAVDDVTTQARRMAL